MSPSDAPAFAMEFGPTTVVADWQFPSAVAIAQSTVAAGAPVNDTPNGTQSGLVVIWSVGDSPGDETVIISPDGEPTDFFGVRLACTADAIGVVSGQDFVDGQRAPRLRLQVQLSLAL